MTVLDQASGRLLIVVVLLGAAALVWTARRRRDGRFRPGAGSGPVLSPADLGHPLGRRATFVQVSAPRCATCPQVARELARVAAGRPGVEHVELRADEHPDLVHRLGILRTPTVLLLGPSGHVLSRTSGPLDHDQAAAALDQEALRAH